MTDLATAFALLLLIEGLALALFPDKIREMLVLLQQAPPEVLRGGGLIAAVLGSFFVWLLRG